LQFYLGKWNFILTRQILSRSEKSKFYFSGLLRLFIWLFAPAGSWNLGKDQFRRSEQNYADFTHFLYAAGLQNLYWQ